MVRKHGDVFEDKDCKEDTAMTDVILYGVLFLAVLYTIYRVDPEHTEGKYTSIWSFYRAVFFSKKGSSAV
jgi:hypothetical protein